MESYAKCRPLGFTLIELLVVIALVALLMGVLMPALRRAREVARMIACAGNQKQVILALAHLLPMLRTMIPGFRPAQPTMAEADGIGPMI
ncbi:MAG: type II secretion system protein [Planctomycetota bacterium]|jgi:prepilin-type N-terminal cleavage/methylation domain-containing protein